ncbi:MAG: choice-of-anchor J domain-containing protein, partial [Bacteroidales bacterium]
MKKVFFLFIAIIFAIQGWSQTAATIPYSCNFEDSDENTNWVISNGTNTNQWHVGVAVTSGSITGNSLYISNDAGVSNAYSDGSPSSVTATRTVEFTGAGGYALEFDVRVGGEGSLYGYPYDYIKVFLVDSSVNYTASNSSTWSSYTSAQGAVLQNMYGTNNYYCYSNDGNPTQVVHMTVILPSQGDLGTVKKLIIGWINDGSGGEQPPACIDNISITEILCSRPTALSVPAATITTNTAEVTWTAGGTEADWTLQYKLTSDSWTNATEITNVTSGYQIQSLNPSSSYDVRVKSVCTAGVDESLWINASFRTQCGAITAFPWTEGFESAWTVTTVPGNATAPDCWINVNNGYSSSYKWQRTTSYPHTGSGAATMYGGYYSATSVYTNSDWLISPIFTLQGSEMLNFYTKSVSTSYPEDISIYILDVTTNGDIASAADTSHFVRIMGPELQTTSWLFHELSLPYTGNYRIAFVRNARPGGQYLCLDDITISEMPLCPNTYNLTSTLRSATEVDLNWMQNGNGNGWVIAYGDTTAFDPSTIAQPIIISSTDPVPYTVTGLTPQTPYSFAVRQNCTDGAWSNIVSVTTPATATTLPYSHDFEDVAENGSWTFINGTQTNQWTIGTAADTLGATGLYVSNDAGVTNAYTVGTSRVYAYRDFEVPVGAGELELSFDWRAQGGSAQTDFLRMYLVPLDANITAGVIPPNGLDASAQIGNYTGGTGEHWLSQSTIWQHKIMRINSLQFPNLAGRTWRLLVHWRNESTTTTNIQPPAAVDNISLTVVTCPTPTTLVASNPTTTSTDLAWQETGQATDWIIEYKENSSTTWLQASATSNPFTLTGLNNSSNYQARVRSLCSASDTSLSSLPISFNTACDIVTAFPWAEGFETSWGTSQIPGNASAPNCWINVNKGDGSSNLWTRSTSYYHTGTGSAQMYTDNNSRNNDWLITPEMTLTGNERLRFWAMNYSATTSEVDEVSIWISDEDLAIDTTNMGVYDSITGFTQIYQTGIPIGNWQQYEVNLNQYLGNRYIAFVRKHTPNNGWDLRIDDVLVEAIPACSRPTNVVSVNNTQNDIEIGWTNGNTTDASWYVYYRPNGTTDFDSVLANSNPYILSGLTSSSIYDVYVKTDCSTDLSEASPIVNLATACGVVTEFPWSEGFEVSTWAPAIAPGNKQAPNCWTVVDKGCTDDADYYWQHSSTCGYTGTSHTGTGHAACYTDYGTTSHNDWLITPQITLNGTERLRFWAMRASSGTGEPDEISVFISDEDAILDTTGMGQYGNMPNFTQIFNQMLPVGNWQQYEVNLSQYSGNRYIAFVRQNTPDGYYLRLDDVLIDELPACARPTSITTSNFTPNTVDLTWVNGNQTDASWYVYFKPTSSTVWDSIQVSTNPYTLSNLTAATSYDVYIRTDCSPDLSEASNIITFQTSCDALTFPTVNEEFNTFLPSVCWERKTGLLPATGTATLSSTTSGWYNNTNPMQTGSGNHPYINIWSTTTQYWLITPTYDLGDGSIATQLEFDAVLSTYDATGAPSSAGIDDKFAVVVSTDNGGTWDVANAFIWSNATGATRVYNSLYPLQRVIVPLINPTTQLPYSGLVRIGFYGESTQSNADNYLHIDNVLIDVLPACARPTAVSTTNGVATSVDVTFTPGHTTDAGWYVYYKPVTSTDWDSIYVISIPATLPNLTLQTTYEIYVKTDCGDGTNSGASNVITYTTPCDATAISSFPWTEGFENGIICWQQIYVNGTLNWTNPIIYNTTQPHEGTKIARFAGDARTNITKLVSPLMDISSLSTPYLSYWYILQNWGTTDRDTLRVYSRPSSDSSWTLLNTFYALDTYAWTKDSIALPNPSSTYQIAFEGIERYGYGVGLDEITVYDDNSTPCASPTNVTVPTATITNTTATVNWTAGGSETAWQVRLDLTGTPVDVNTPTYQLPSLAPGTNYTVYVRANCGTSFSAWVSQTFTTTAGYQLPIVTTIAQTGTNQTSTTLNGSYVQGTNPILVKGFEWKPST